ncbi:TraB/VirB10 family protein [Geobacter pelophilus]|uniref:TraB/VirB10 family protein n=1 Tax=Geoanaerobacter pelophilus TaxID=60036 RepID=A0AAW4L0Z0_9BACT|nr:TrbI/VirB10 family protein [Geoanaerobacter pelophilus]MBT0663155.1 TraB/VirB10 family protein [Geoanaerobacter pelophilus]
MKNRLLSVWNNLNGNQRRLVVWIGGGCAFLAVFFFGNMAMNRGKNQLPAKSAKLTTLDIEPKLLEKSQFLESQKEISKRDDKVAELQKRLDEITREKSGQVVTQPQLAAGAAATVQGDPRITASAQLPGQSQKAGFPKALNSKQPLPPPPPMPQGSMPLPPLPSTTQGMPAGQPLSPPETEIGDIAIVTHSGAGKSSKVEAEDKKKDTAAASVYLPPSFMEATLLSGLDAPTTSEAKGNPVPVLLRVKTPAVLPNSVKANLKGCFVIADGKGNLATERAELLLVSLSCLDRKGQAVVDQKVKGFVVDEDGKIGLRGRVVAKMGSMIARSMLAGFFGGAGDAIKASATTLAVSPLGTTQTVDPKDIAMSGVGSGLSSGFKEIQKFYMELARQTMPVIEVGATKPVTLVISEGINLEIKRIVKGGRK